MENPATACQTAKELFHSGFPQDALQRLRIGLEETPDAGQVWELYGVIQHAQQAFAEALGALETATTLRPLSLGGQLALADCYRRSDARQTAESMFQHLARRPDLPRQYVPDIVCGLAAVGDYPTALELSRKIAEQDPTCVQALYGTAYYMARCGYPTELVIPIMRHVVQLAPYELRFRVALGMLHLTAGQHDMAYQVVVKISCEQLATVNCRRCLYQFADLFETRGDETRRCVCLVRARALREED